MSAWKKSAVWILTVVFAGWFVFGVVAPARAAEFRSGDTVVIAADEVLRALPFGLGWLIGVVVTLIGLGAIYFVAREMFRPAPAPAA